MQHRACDQTHTRGSVSGLASGDAWSNGSDKTGSHADLGLIPENRTVRDGTLRSAAHFTLRRLVVACTCHRRRAEPEADVARHDLAVARAAQQREAQVTQSFRVLTVQPHREVVGRHRLKRRQVLSAVMIRSQRFEASSRLMLRHGKLASPRNVRSSILRLHFCVNPGGRVVATTPTARDRHEHRRRCLQHRDVSFGTETARTARRSSCDFGR